MLRSNDRLFSAQMDYERMVGDGSKHERDLLSISDLWGKWTLPLIVDWGDEAKSFRKFITETPDNRFAYDIKQPVSSMYTT